jgi:hypothetical protein
MPAPLDTETVRGGFEALDRILPGPVTLIVGGGTAMFLAHGVRVRTTDVDAYPQATPLEELDPLVKQVARDRGLSPDWINPHFATFAHVLPADYGARLVQVFAGQRLKVMALGVEDLLIMKCFAGREKDVGHARALLRRKPDLGIVERRLQELMERRIPGATDAADFFDDLREGT